MTPDDMKVVAAECQALARELAPVQDAGLFAPRTLNWTGLVTTADGGSSHPAEMRVVATADGNFDAVLKVGNTTFAVRGTPDAASARPVISPKLVHRVVNATLSAANTFDYLLAGGPSTPAAPDPKG